MVNADPTEHLPAAQQTWAIEAWRGFAALMVVWVHWGPTLGWPMGIMHFAFTGVDLFFVLSGFVFAPTLFAGQTPALRAYAIRRAARIYPAYLAALALYALLAWHAGRPLLHLPEHLLMLQMQSREMVFYYNPVFWSLPAEVSFYALVPLLALWLARDTRWRWPLLFALALALRLALVRPADGAAQNWAYLSLHHLPGLLVEFLLGAWVWQRHTAVPPHAPCRPHVWVLAALGIAGWLALALLYLQLERWSGISDWRNGQIALAAAVCFALVLRASLRCPAPAVGSLVWHCGRWAGKLSYPLYLLHTAWLIPAHALLAHGWSRWLVSTLAIAGLLASCWLLHQWVEEPARQIGRRWAARY